MTSPITALSKKFLFLSLLAFAVLCPLGLSQQSPEGRPLVLQGATVIDGRGGPPVSGGVILIAGDRIQSVGARGTNVPAEATVVDLSGKFIIPGLIESHAHYGEWMGEVFLNHGVTSIMAVGGRFGEKKEASQQSAARTPRIFDTAGDPRLSPSLTREQVRDAVQQWLQGKPDFARLRSFFDDRGRQVYQWAAEEIHRAGLMVFGHTENAPESIRAGQDSVEHIWGFAQAQMSPQELDEFQRGQHLHWAPFFRDWTRLDQMIREAVDRGAYINPTFLYEMGSLSALAARHEQEDYLLYSNPRLMAYYPKHVAESLLQKHRQIRSFSGKYENLVLISRLTPEELEEFKQGYRLAGEFLKRFVQAGGKLQAGTDTLSGGTPGLSLHQEMELFVEAGLTPMQALQSATLWSAEMLSGKDGVLGAPQVGVIAEGAFADLVVLAANPLEDIGNTKNIERVMKGGAFIELGYDPAYYTFTQPARSIAMATPVPGISAITPHTVAEGTPEFEILVEGVGFVGNSVVRVNGVSVPTTFVGPRRLKARVPADTVERARPNPFDAPGPAQNVGVFGDRTVPITVFNGPPEGGLSNRILLRVQAKWMGPE
ncbi:MAG: amidohydrolase family protein [Acidobacteria bacterium]|nr:amidohydrolase family protein [Acidobacteriota bacterium]